jgi:GNAT superfamily N-acetyltransferase
VAQSDPAGALVLNFVVAPEERGKGIGYTMLGAAAEWARTRWDAERMYAVVDDDNEVGR